MLEDRTFNDFDGDVWRIACEHDMAPLNRQVTKQFEFAGVLRQAGFEVGLEVIHVGVFDQAFPGCVEHNVTLDGPAHRKGTG
ncbi:hypothetical protein D3C81_1813370 [compost metagenome]